MANGINHAKKIVLDQAQELAHNLQNGNSGDQHLQGKAIGLVIQMITPLYEADFTTTEACEKIRALRDKVIIDKLDSLDAKRDQTEAARESRRKATDQKGPATLKLGPLELKGSVVPIFVILGILLVPSALIMYILGKTSGWW